MIFAVVGQKGGVGKSTMSICLASEFMERGYKVLLVDADPQGTTRTWGDVAAEKAAQGRKVRTPSVIAMGATMHRAGQLATVAKPYDVTVIDCPPRHGDIQRSALMIADVAIVPCGPSGADTWALGDLRTLINEAQTLREQLRACVLINKQKPNTVMGRDARSVIEQAGFETLDTEIGDRVPFWEAITDGLGVTNYAPNDPAAFAIRRLVDELARRFMSKNVTPIRGKEKARRVAS